MDSIIMQRDQMNYAKIFSKEDLDTFVELGNIAAGNAANFLSKTVNKKVILELPQPKYDKVSVHIKEIVKIQSKVFFTMVFISGYFKATIFLLFSLDDIKRILNFRLETETLSKSELRTLKNNKTVNIEKIDILTKMEHTYLQNFYNNLIKIYKESFEKFLEVTLTVTESQFFLDKTDSAIKKLPITEDLMNEKNLLLEAIFKIPLNNPLKGHFYLLIGKNAMKKIVTRIKEIW